MAPRGGKPRGALGHWSLVTAFSGSASAWPGVTLNSCVNRLHPATVAVLDLLGLLDAQQQTALATWREPIIRNYRGLITGRVEPAVRLQRLG